MAATKLIVASKVDAVPFQDAVKFIQALHPSSTTWSDPDRIRLRFVFRGQGDAGWRLEPSALRAEGWKELEPLATASLRAATATWAKGAAHLYGAMAAQFRDGHEQERAAAALLHLVVEYEAVHSFFEIADDIGLWAPSKEELWNAERALGYYTSERLDLTFHPHESFGIAQHHGVPTRLLDWTSHPLAAAYFAARDAVEKGTEELAVWALDRVAIEGGAGAASPYQQRLEVTAMRKHKDEYLHAQHGLFVTDRLATEEYAATGVWPPLDEVIQRTYDELQRRNLSPTPPLHKFTLPTSEAQRMLKLLYKERVTIAHLMPNYDSAAKAAKETWGS